MVTSAKAGICCRETPPKLPSPHYHIGLHPLCRSKEVQQGNGRRSDVAYHDTRYQQHDIALYQRGKEKDKYHNQHGSDKCAKQHGEEAGQTERPCRDATAKQQHDEGHSQTCPGVDAQNGWSCQRILESRLQHQSADSQCATAKQRRQRLGQTGFPKDEAPACLLPLSTEQDTENIGRRNRNRPYQQIARKSNKITTPNPIPYFQPLLIVTLFSTQRHGGTEFSITFTKVPYLCVHHSFSLQK